MDLLAQGGAGEPLAPLARPCAPSTCLALVTLCMVFEPTRQPGGAWAGSPSRCRWRLTGAMWKLLHGQVGGLGGALLLAPNPSGAWGGGKYGSTAVLVSCAQPGPGGTWVVF